MIPKPQKTAPNRERFFVHLITSSPHRLIASLTLSISHLGVDVAPQMPGDLILEVLEKNSAGELADYIAGNIMLEYKKRQTILNEVNPLRRLEKVCCLLAKEGDLMRLENDINKKVQENIDKSQREYYLHEQMKVISDELNDGVSVQEECEEFKEKIKALSLEEESEKKLLKEKKNRFELITSKADPSKEEAKA